MFKYSILVGRRGLLLAAALISFGWLLPVSMTTNAAADAGTATEPTKFTSGCSCTRAALYVLPVDEPDLINPAARSGEAVFVMGYVLDARTKSNVTQDVPVSFTLNGETCSTTTGEGGIIGFFACDFQNPIPQKPGQTITIKAFTPGSSDSTYGPSHATVKIKVTRDPAGG